MSALSDWLDQRLDYRRYAQHMRQRVLPEGPGWWYTSASCLFWLLIIECVTGLLLMASYSPSMASAWASVHFIDQTSAGRFLRGLHHYSSHALIILFGLHVLRVLVMGAYRAPRELVWITGLLLFPLVIVWTVTGNPLSASQKGIAQIQVEGNILGGTPWVGPLLQRLLFGGDEIGNLTLTRLYFLHVGLLPLLVGGLCFVHLHQVIKHSPYRPMNLAQGASASNLLPYWPYQTFRNMTTLAMVVGILAWLSWQYGAPLHAPADPELPHAPRPEWYFRWLFELRRYFTGNTEFIATLVIPSAFLLAFLSVPILDRFIRGTAGVVCRLLVVAACAGGWGWLTYVSYRQDFHDQEYQLSEAEFESLSARARELAGTTSIGNAGAVELLRHDPLVQGPRLFARQCAGCHAWTDSQGRGIVAAEPSAPNLFGLGTADWILGFLDAERIAGPAYFSGTSFREGDMVQHVRGLKDDAGAEGGAALQEKLRAVASALAAEAGHEPYDSPQAVQGREWLVSGMGCVDCHKFHEHGESGSAPDLTGYASSAWLTAMIARPNDARFYGDRNDRMPAFVADAEHPELNLLTPQEVDLLVRWLASPASSPRRVEHLADQAAIHPTPGNQLPATLVSDP